MKSLGIYCSSLESAATAEKYLGVKLNMCKVMKEELNKPIVKIIGIQNLEQNQKEHESDINTRNFAKFNTKGKILYQSEGDKSGKQTAVMEVTPELHNHIKVNKNKLFVGHQICRIYDVINVKPCQNCGGFSHNARKCKNESACLICAGKHLTKNCTEINTKYCVNCNYSNRRYKNNYNTNHTATDTEACEILKNKIKHFLNTTEYLVRPDIPKHVGKVENFNRYPHRVNRASTTDNSEIEHCESDKNLQEMATLSKSRSSILGSNSSLVRARISSITSGPKEY